MYQGWHTFQTIVFTSIYIVRRGPFYSTVSCCTIIILVTFRICTINFKSGAGKVILFIKFDLQLFLISWTTLYIYTSICLSNI